MIDEKLKKSILNFQRNEITEHYIYERLANSTKNSNNKKVLMHLSKDELRHYNLWKNITKKDVKPKTLIIWLYFLMSKLLGLTFGIKLMEGGEARALREYGEVSKQIPIAKSILKDEIEHEKKVIRLIDEEFLNYAGSMVLGLNDALVELTGALAGLTLAFQNTKLISIAGLIIGVAASLSMAASEYLSKKTDAHSKNPITASIYTGIAYVITVVILILPYFILTNPYSALALTILFAVIIIFIFNFYICVAKEFEFKKRFFEMLIISLGIAALTFVIGYFIRIYFGIEV